MIKAQNAVRIFHSTFGIDTGMLPQIPDKKTIDLRIELITEELNELADAFAAKDLVEVADAIGDLLYVVLGTAVTCGIHIPPIFDAIHASNMTKEGGYTREDGKYMKPDTYTPVDLKPHLAKQAPIIPISQRGIAWLEFAERVLNHIENYTVPQYGDKGEDQVTNWTEADCVKAVQKYTGRHGKNIREGQAEIDLVKMAHYSQLAHEKHTESK